MNTWILLLAAVGIVQLVGAVLFVAKLRHAPEGYQDESGFHPGAEPTPPMTSAKIVTLPVDSSSFGHAA